MGKRIITNAKCRRVSVCNALDCLLIHESRLNDLRTLCEELAKHETKIHADTKAYEALKGNYPDTLLYLRATYKLTNHQGEKQEVTQTFYLDKGLTRVIGFKEN
jgi:gamma-glutamyl phosphate reductase